MGTLVKLILTAGGAAGLLLLLIYLFQDRLLFFPQTMSEQEAEQAAAREPRAETVQFEMDDGTELHGWLMQAEEQPGEQLLVYYGGNGEEVSGQIMEMAGPLSDWDVLLVNYRGYGMSGGTPEEEALYQDAEHIFEEAAAGYERTAMMGRSIGTAIAVRTAAIFQPDDVVLISPFDRLEEVAAEAYPFLPVRTLLRSEFDTASRINELEHMLVLAGGSDQIITPARTEALLDEYEGEAVFHLLEGRGHNDLHLHPEFWPLIEAYLQERS
ncbi:alpha/beta hydrolase [Alkalicoccus luteus]|uniref:alpha/beta hydrolase n=1 Tax=Alkalicoccus luteus TaxID=1237094 RepID=UPI004033B6DA